MQKIAIILRTAQLLAHNAHNLASGPTFFADHDFFGDLYAEYEGDYDSLVERYIGLDLAGSGELQEITRMAGIGAGSYNIMSTESAIRALVGLEDDLVVEIVKQAGLATIGTQNLLQGLADKSEARVYKFNQRIKS